MLFHELSIKYWLDGEKYQNEALRPFHTKDDNYNDIDIVLKIKLLQSLVS